VKLDSPTAFGFAPAPFGAALVWARLRKAGNALLALDLNELGVSERPPFELVELPSEVEAISDVSTAFQGMNRAALWVADVAGKARVQAAYKSENESARWFQLGTGYRASLDARGNAVMAAGDDDLTAFVRGEPEACVDGGNAPCYGFRFHRFAAAEEPSTRVTLSVPVPCEDAAAQLLLTSPRWYYSVCTTLREQPVVTLFTIQPKPEYAAATELFSSCVPRGLALAGDRPALVAACGAESRVAWLGAADRKPATESFEPIVPSCDDLPTLHVAGHSFTLTEPRGGLELFLPESIAPRGSLAVWAGRALLVAWAEGGTLRLRRHGCRGDSFVDLGSVEIPPSQAPEAG
jgi:hypothetical protein